MSNSSTDDTVATSDGLQQGAATPSPAVLDVDTAILLGVASQVRRVSISNKRERAVAKRQLADAKGGALQYRSRLFSEKLTDRDLLASIPRTIDGVPGYALRGDGVVTMWNPLKLVQPYSMPDTVRTIEGVNLHIADVRVGTGQPFPLRAGVLAVSGPSNVGKSPLARSVAEAACATLNVDDYIAIPFGEPYAGYGSDEAILPASLLYAMSKSPIVVLDSIKDLVLDAGGAAGKGGLSRVSQKFLSKLGPAAAQLGCVVIIPLNPSSTSKEAIAEFYSGIMSTCSGFLQHDGGQRWAWTVRPVEHEERVSGSFSRDKREGSQTDGQSNRQDDIVVLAPDKAATAQSKRVFETLRRLARDAGQF